jgi:hypothetical protein
MERKIMSNFTVVLDQKIICNCKGEIPRENEIIAIEKDTYKVIQVIYSYSWKDDFSCYTYPVIEVLVTKES